MTDNYKKDTQTNPHKVTLNLTQSDKIIISFKDPLNLIGNNYIEPILFSDNDDLILLTKENIYHLLLELSNSLKKALNNKLPFDDFATPDIGLAFNQHYCYAPTSYYERLRTKAPTKIKPYALWEKNYEKSKYKIWIYNNY